MMVHFHIYPEYHIYIAPAPQRGFHFYTKHHHKAYLFEQRESNDTCNHIGNIVTPGVERAV